MEDARQPMHRAAGGPTLRGERVTLRPMAEADLPRLLEIVNAPGVREWWVEGDEASLRGDAFGDEHGTSFAVELDAEVIGLVLTYEEPEPHYEYASVDIALEASHLGQGLGPEALRTVIRWLIDVRGHHRITIDPAATNERAIAAYRKVGFKPVGIMRGYELGRDGVWRDGLLMDLLAGEET